MKNLLASVCFVALVWCIHADDKPGPVSVGLLTQDVDGIVMRQYQVGAVCALDITSWFTLSIPVLYTYEQQDSSWMVEAFAHGAFYPGGGNIWVGSTLLHHILLHAKEDEHIWMHELSVGYTLAIGSRWKLSPYVVFRDPYRRYREELDMIQEYFPSYSTVEPGLMIRWYPGGG